MTYNFDEIIDRKNTNSIKHDFAVERGLPEDVIPLWVADMDFRTAPEIIEAITKAALHGIYGYSEMKLPYFEAIRDWYCNYFNWEWERPWLVKTPGVVFAICTAIRAFTKPGDCVLIQRPVYYPFTNSIQDNGRIVVNNPLLLKEGVYQMDFEDFESKIIANNVKLFILCNPHNPVGRVWTKEELTRIGDICMKHGVTVVSDEIHADFVYEGFQHTIFASIKPEFADFTVTCTAPSKTFNLAGLQTSNIFIKNRELRHAFRDKLYSTGYMEVGTFGLVACHAAYQEGRLWLEDLKEYLAGNLEFIRSFLQKELPQVKLIEPQGTYLVWLDFRELGLSEEQLEDLIVHKAKLWLDRGSMFGPEGAGFERFNIACPRGILIKAFDQLKQAVIGA